MEVILIRHATALPRGEKWPDDRERPLSSRGQQRGAQAARGLARLLDEPPTLVLTSPLVRTLQTAALLTRHADWPSAVECVELSPGRGSAGVLTRLRKERHPRVALVGHEPGLGNLLAYSLWGEPRGEVFEVKRFAAALLSFPDLPRAGKATLHWLVPPRLLRACQ